jgi:hypothetical protein
MRSRVIPASSMAGQRKAALAALLRAFPVPVRVLGQSMAPVIPQQVGNWWLEPLGPATLLPARAQRRLHAVVSAGVVPRAVVVLHELLPTPPARSSAIRRHAVAAARALPPMAAAVERSALRLLPVLGWLLVAAVRVLLCGLAAVAAALVPVDPCLVVVTEDGWWLEVDRWAA